MSVAKCYKENKGRRLMNADVYVGHVLFKWRMPLNISAQRKGMDNAKIWGESVPGRRNSSAKTFK